MSTKEKQNTHLERSLHGVPNKSGPSPAEQRLGSLRPADPHQGVPRPAVLPRRRALYPGLEDVQGDGGGVRHGGTNASSHEVRPVGGEGSEERCEDGECDAGGDRGPRRHPDPGPEPDTSGEREEVGEEGGRGH